MSLLTRTTEEFSSTEYWEHFFKKRGEKAFDWYGDYNKLCGMLLKYIKPRDKILVGGCGNSELSEQLYDVVRHGESHEPEECQLPGRMLAENLCPSRRCAKGRMAPP
uniref:eEF1A lysine and N-terminal methyltransferase n=1 Tax=Salmo trutta TaxID=8032 RepID=A0A673YIG2_SALTR